jgi:hypothetical protein
VRFVFWNMIDHADDDEATGNRLRTADQKIGEDGRGSDTKRQKDVASRWNDSKC